MAWRRFFPPANVELVFFWGLITTWFSRSCLVNALPLLILYLHHFDDDDIFVHIFITNQCSLLGSCHGGNIMPPYHHKTIRVATIFLSGFHFPFFVSMECFLLLFLFFDFFFPIIVSPHRCDSERRWQRRDSHGCHEATQKGPNNLVDVRRWYVFFYSSYILLSLTLS